MNDPHPNSSNAEAPDAQSGKNQMDETRSREERLIELLGSAPRPTHQPAYYPGAGEYHPSHVLAGRVINS